MPLVIDVAEDVTPHLPALVQSGIKTVFGYLSSINPNGAKCWTVARVKAAAAHGLRIGLVHEGFGGVGGKGITEQDGIRDGAYCRGRVAMLGAPAGACVYFACDQDFTEGQIKQLVIPYFAAIRKAFEDGHYRVGVYGSGAVCAAVIDAKLADLSWLAQSKGWAGFSEWKVKASQVQGAEGMIAGVDADPDTPQGDIGDYVPVFAAAAASDATKSAPVFPPQPAPVAHPQPFDWFFRLFQREPTFNIEGDNKMNLPTQAQVNAATRNIASAAAGAIVMFGLSTKIDPQTVIALIKSLGTLTNDAITVIGIASPIIMAWYASRSARVANQKQAVVATQPGTVVVETNSQATATRVAQVIAAIPEVNKVVAAPAVADAAPSDKVVAK